MNLLLFGAILWCSVTFWTASADDGSYSATNALFRCGIRKKMGVQLIHNAQSAELGQWPWHAALYHQGVYKCGGTLIDQHHVVTSAHCVIGNVRTNREIQPALVTIHLGRTNLDDNPDHVQIMNVSRIHKHPAFTTNRHDIALLVMPNAVRYSEYVIPICFDGIHKARVGDLEGKRGWVAGFGATESSWYSKHLKTASIPIVNNTECVQSDPELFGRFVSPAVFCGSDRNGTSVCQGDSGGGVYILAGDHWELRGIASFAGKAEMSISCDVTKYVVFTSVAYYYEWIKKLTGVGDRSIKIPKRISELKCRQYSKFARKRQNGVCYNARSPHTVAIIDQNQRHISSGSIISEKYVLTKAPSLFDIFKSDVDWDDLWVRLGNQPDKRVIHEVTHPDYDPETLRHHIMLLELDSPLTFTNRLLPACLANVATENLYDTLLLNGYSGKSAITNDFYESVENQLIANEQCDATVKKSHRKYTVQREEICATDRFEGAFIWTGIVGGPLQTVNTRSCMFTQVGVTKILIPNDNNQEGTTRFTNVYSRITAYLDWIEQSVWGNETIPAGVDLDDDTGEAPMDEDEETTTPTVRSGVPLTGGKAQQKTG